MRVWGGGGGGGGGGGVTTFMCTGYTFMTSLGKESPVKSKSA